MTDTAKNAPGRVAMARELEQEASVRDVFTDVKTAGVFAQYRDETWFKFARMTQPPGLRLAVSIPGDANWMAQTAAHAAGPPLPGMSTPEAPDKPDYFPSDATAEAVYLGSVAGDADAVAEALQPTLAKFSEAMEAELSARKEATDGEGGGDIDATKDEAEARHAAERIAVRKKLGWSITDCHGGLSALSHACAKASLGTAKALLEAGASVVSFSEDGVGALHRAAEWRSISHNQHQLITRVEFLTGRPPPPSKQGGEAGGGGAGSTNADERSLQAGQVIELLLSYGSDVHAKTAEGATALHICARDGRSPQVLSALLAGGASALERDEMGVTPLMAACAGGDAAIVTALLEHIETAKAEELSKAAEGAEGAEGAGEADGGSGNDVQRAARTAVAEALAMADRFGMQPLHHAIEGGHTSLALMLVKRGAAVSATTRGKRPLKKLHPLTARALLRQVREMEIEMGVEPGETGYSDYGSLGSRPSTAQQQLA